MIELKTKCHPEADGRQPQAGETDWTLTFPLENDDQIRLSLGKLGFDTMSQFILDDLAGTPSYSDGSLDDAPRTATAVSNMHDPAERIAEVLQNNVRLRAIEAAAREFYTAAVILVEDGDYSEDDHFRAVSARFVREKPELNKEEILAVHRLAQGRDPILAMLTAEEREKLLNEARATLKQLGVAISQTESFYLEPDRDGQPDVRLSAEAKEAA